MPTAFFKDKLVLSAIFVGSPGKPPIKLNLQEYILKHSGFPERSIKNTVDLLNTDATIPFIARYRKEQTGNLDEVQIEKIADLLKAYKELESRRASILKAIEEQGALNPELQQAINRSKDLTDLEDLYLPFKKKRKTRADIAREAGLEPLAKIIMSQREDNLNATSRRFLNEKVNTVEEALQGAKDIIAEWVNEHQMVRGELRMMYFRKAKISSTVVKKKAEEPAAQKYQQYFDWEEPLRNIPSHRFLALYRAGNEGLLRLKIEVDQEEALSRISGIVIKNRSHSSAETIREAIEDAYSRLLKPSFYSEFLSVSKKKADEEAINVFASNLEQLLLSPPLGGKRIMGIDPGFRSGCKIVCLDENGSLLFNETVFPHPPQKETAMATRKIRSLVNAYKVEAIAIGNGTASRETEDFIKKASLDNNVEIFIVNEAGASVYSASKAAREEFPDYDITVRGAVSIGRRLSDPLAELVKIDPKSIGVGQYQHEVDQNRLKEKLDTVVASCVNRIGVNVNTASKELLSYVSGIGPSLAENIICYRNEKGNLRERKSLMEIPRLGAKAFEQAAGFLRIKDSPNPLDNSAVHPERYDVVKKMAKDLSVSVKELIGNKPLLQKISLQPYANKEMGLPTLQDIMKELEKPGVDPRKTLKSFSFNPNVKTIEDLKAGMSIPGIVNNITNFGCFVDIGIKESGLVHISKLANSYISDVNSVVKLNQQVVVKVLEVDVNAKRIQLSMID